MQLKSHLRGNSADAAVAASRSVVGLLCLFRIVQKLFAINQYLCLFHRNVVNMSWFKKKVEQENSPVEVKKHLSFCLKYLVENIQI